MIKDIISFIVSDYKFVSDFQKTPIILTASDYINFGEITNGNFPKKFLFDEVDVEILNISQFLGLNNVSFSPQTKILVGEIENRLFGILVDQVIEIINLNEDIGEQIECNKSSNIFGEDALIDIASEKCRFIDMDDFVKNNVL